MEKVAFERAVKELLDKGILDYSVELIDGFGYQITLTMKDQKAFIEYIRKLYKRKFSENELNMLEYQALSVCFDEAILRLKVR